MRRFGPMHGEATSRFQFVGESSHSDELIVSTYLIRETNRLAVEFYRPAEGITSAHLTTEEAGWLREALDEFIEAHR